MPVHPRKNRPDFKLEITDGKLTLQTKFRMIWKPWMLTSTIIILILVILAILQPEGWLDILRAILLILKPALLIAAGKYKNLNLEDAPWLKSYQR
jgi:hypothetical protein